jgi:IS5 family transposase
MESTGYQMGFFDQSERLARLDKLGDILPRMDRMIDFEMFRAPLEKGLGRERRSAAGRPPLDSVFMFRILLLQRFYNLSDEQTGYQINDRLSFQRFLGLGVNSPVPDYSTVWRFREALTNTGAIKPLFDLLAQKLVEHGVMAREGSIVDATMVEVPRQRNSREENKMIKEGKIPPAWEKQPRKLCQKDIDARWLTKNGVDYYGYKDHVLGDLETKLIRDYAVSEASVHDSQLLPELVNETHRGAALLGDSAYKSVRTDAWLETIGVKNFIHDKAARNRPLPPWRIALNRLKSRSRGLVEHIFGCMENSLGGPALEYIGKARVATGIGLTNLAYNLLRLLQLHKLGRATSWPCHARMS